MAIETEMKHMIFLSASNGRENELFEEVKISLKSLVVEPSTFLFHGGSKFAKRTIICW
jgi:hypothetical protein